MDLVHLQKGGMIIFHTPYEGLNFNQNDLEMMYGSKLSDEISHYQYLCTHVDAFMIMTKQPELIMKQIRNLYKVKLVVPPEYYLENDCNKYRRGWWCIGCKKYLKESL